MRTVKNWNFALVWLFCFIPLQIIAKDLGADAICENGEGKSGEEIFQISSKISTAEKWKLATRILSPYWQRPGLNVISNSTAVICKKLVSFAYKKNFDVYHETYQLFSITALRLFLIDNNRGSLL